MSKRTWLGEQYAGPLNVATGYVGLEGLDTLARIAGERGGVTRLLIGAAPSSESLLGPPGEARTPRKDRGAKDHRAPNHISKTVLSTVHLGPPEKNRTGDAVNCRGLQQGTGSTFRGAPQVPF